MLVEVFWSKDLEISQRVFVQTSTDEPELGKADPNVTPGD